MFGSLFSHRYNRKRELFYAHYEATRQRYPNLPIYKRAKEPLPIKAFKRGRKKCKPVDYDYDGWIAGNFVSIVVRRTIEQWSCCQLMEPAGNDAIDVFSWRSWPSEIKSEDTEPRRSRRLTYRATDIGNDMQLGTNDDDATECEHEHEQFPIRNAKRAPRSTLDSEIGRQKQKSQPKEQTETQTETQTLVTVINDSRHDYKQQQQRQRQQQRERRHPQQQCSMCGSYFGKSSDLELHSLDDCRKYLLATLNI